MAGPDLVDQETGSPWSSGVVTVAYALRVGPLVQRFLLWFTVRARDR